MTERRIPSERAAAGPAPERRQAGSPAMGQDVVAAPEERVEPAGMARGMAPGAPGAPDGGGALFGETDAEALNQLWEGIQGGFVDEPRRAVEQADALVSDVVHRLTETFARERARLEQQWTRGDDVSTEDLRVALQRYRSFFQRLLSA